MREEIIGDARLILGDCREVLPTLERVDAVVTDPPYGIGKADWDAEFSLEWVEQCVNPSVKKIAITPGNWNLGRMPQRIGVWDYHWTLSAYLINGMTRGGVGWGNWIPCVLYRRFDPKKNTLKPDEVRDWCSAFSDWLKEKQISTASLNEVLGTKSMAGRYREKTWGILPSSQNWEVLKSWFDIPDCIDPPWDYIQPKYEPVSDCKTFSVGTEKKPDHPSPKPLNVMEWFVSIIQEETILDPFMGSGTTGVACARLGRRFIGIEIEERYFSIACRRIEAAYKQADLFVAAPAPKVTQPALFGDAP